MWNFVECFSEVYGQFELIEFLLIFLHENHVGGQLGCDVVQGVS